ncbi:carbon-phosphorus lyase complex subunit PhnI [Rhizobium jaguaris]|uniref:carbon-phosphorus lyase complex subunit PhnI n=1 Tax=Rhizobium jaguaris TaxID=1312183 RepID=UPI0039BF2028
MYVAVKGGERAILNSHKLIAEERRGDTSEPELSVGQIESQLGLAVDRVMTEGSLYDRELAALALKQAQGDVVEAVFLLRAYRTTLPRIGITEPIDTAAMDIERRVSAAFKDLPGGQVLGPTYDYTHRLLDFDLMEVDGPAPQAEIANQPLDDSMPRVTDIVGQEDFMEHEIPVREGEPVYDLTRQPMAFPANRDQRLQNLARGDEGFLTALAYSTMRGYGGSHPYVGEIRMGEVPVEFVPEELGFAIEIGDIVVTECQMINQFGGSKTEAARFTRGYGLALGKSERKAMAMSLVDRALRCRELGEMARFPAQDEEFVLYHTDNVEAAGFVSHLKLPHYVDFQGDLQLLRGLRAEFEARQTKEAAE